MAQKVQVLLVDDVDGGEAEETVSFSVDGINYEIDLSGVHAKQLREAVAPFLQAARKAPSRPGRGTRGPKQRTAPNRERSAEIRAWAKEHGKDVSERGRIPQAIVDEFYARKG
ncbi:Lsr2 family protein [Nocardiopsis mangrovi]|uniref:Lsr2 family protein n=1 Tax=Nocardiopsis mangrovi TaxID=1179818 RepID=A0ABV9DZ39_9ACTN